MKCTLTLLVFGATLFAACAGDPVTTFCATMNDCAHRAGQSVDTYKCDSAIRPKRLAAQKVGCGAEFDAYIDCISSVPCSASQSEVDVTCATREGAYMKCAR